VRVATRGFAAFELASLRLGAVAPTVHNIKQGGSPVVIPRDIQQRQTPPPERAADAAATATIGPIASGQMHHDLQTLANPGARAAFAQAPITASVLSDLYFRANPP
jgi:hypothetical protein